jgi:hypothetical protein
MPSPAIRPIPAVLLLSLVGGPVAAQADTLLVFPGSPLVRGTGIEEHSSRTVLRSGSPDGEPRGTITNYMEIGDSAGRKVIRFRTEGEIAGPGGARNTYTLRQTFDRETLQPLGFHAVGSAGRETSFRIDTTQVTGWSKAPDGERSPFAKELSRRAFHAGATDIILGVLPLRTGLVVRMPVWSPGMPEVDERIYTVGDSVRVSMGGRMLRGWTVEERSVRRNAVIGTMVALAGVPFMETYDVVGPDGSRSFWRQELLTLDGAPVGRE